MTANPLLQHTRRDTPLKMDTISTWWMAMTDDKYTSPIFATKKSLLSFIDAPTEEQIITYQTCVINYIFIVYLFDIALFIFL